MENLEEKLLDTLILKLDKIKWDKLDECFYSEIKYTIIYSYSGYFYSADEKTKIFICISKRNKNQITINISNYNDSIYHQIDVYSFDALFNATYKKYFCKIDNFLENKRKEELEEKKLLSFLSAVEAI